MRIGMTLLFFILFTLYSYPKYFVNARPLTIKSGFEDREHSNIESPTTVSSTLLQNDDSDCNSNVLDQFDNSIGDFVNDDLDHFNISGRNETDGYVATFEDEFKGFGSVFKAFGRGLSKWGSKAMKQLKKAGHLLAKKGPKAWKKVKKWTGEAFGALTHVAMMGSMYASMAMDLYTRQKYMEQLGAAATGSTITCPPDLLCDDFYQPEEPVRIRGHSNMLYDPATGQILGMPGWAVGVAVAAVVLMILGGCGFLYYGGKRDYNRRRRRRRRDDDSESGTGASEVTTLATTRTEMPETTVAGDGTTIAASSVATTEATTVTEATKKTAKKKKKAGRIRTILDRVEESIYAPKKKKAQPAKGKKKGVETTTITTNTTMATEATMTSTEANLPSSKSKSKAKQMSKKQATKSKSAMSKKKASIKKAKSKKK